MNALRSVSILAIACAALCPQPAFAQEAPAGVGLRATLSAEAAASSLLTEDPREGAPVAAGFRGVVYPLWKLNRNWAITGALEGYTHPYFYDSFTVPGYGAKGEILQATLNYARVSGKGSLLVRAGQLLTAFGSYPLRYDDADNPLIDAPMEYGYYGTVSVAGLISAQLDATRGPFDARVQLANSSPANPRAINATDQYINWAGGAGYTIRQGLRIGVSAYRGPYLDRQEKFFRPGEIDPSDLPAHALGADASWAHGHWNVLGEFQSFTMPYTVVPKFLEQTGYMEAKRVLNARWYIAARSGYTATSSSKNAQQFEAAAGFRPNAYQLLKASYEFEHHNTGEYAFDKTFAIQLVTTLKW